MSYGPVVDFTANGAGLGDQVSVDTEGNVTLSFRVQCPSWLSVDTGTLWANGRVLATFPLAPAGAGATLTGPGGDGLLSVVTPSSPVGKAVRRRRVGDVVSVRVHGEVREWTITWVA